MSRRSYCGRTAPHCPGLHAAGPHPVETAVLLNLNKACTERREPSAAIDNVISVQSGPRAEREGSRRIAVTPHLCLSRTLVAGPVPSLSRTLVAGPVPSLSRNSHCGVYPTWNAGCLSQEGAEALQKYPLHVYGLAFFRFER